MIIRGNRFNIYLFLILSVALLAGCKSTSPKRQLSALRLHLEVNRDNTDRNKPVPVYRDAPVMVNVENQPFLTEANITEARVIDSVGGFSIKLQFERRGTWLLEQYTSANQGKRIAIYSEFKYPAGAKTNTVRWLAAPRITKRIADGTLVFTPDATKDEASQIVLGLNNLAHKLEDKSKW